MATKEKIQKRYDFLIEFLMKERLLRCEQGNVWSLHSTHIDEVIGSGLSIELALANAIDKRQVIIDKWLGTSAEQKRIEQNQSTALLVDSLIAGSNG